MAKKTIIEEETDVDYSDSIVQSLIEQFGDICHDGTELITKPKRVISVSPSIDLILHGGIPESSTVLCAGPHSCGKTTLALWFAANCQQEGRYVYYLDVEHRLKPLNLKGIPHLKYDTKHFRVVRSEKGSILSAEQFIDVILKILHGHPESVIIVDSASALCSAKELTNEEIKSEARNEGPKLLATMCRRMSGVINVHNNILFLNQHLIANTSGYGPQKMVDGGNKIQYQADIKIIAKKTETIKVGTDPNPIGQKVQWQCEKSALSNGGREWSGVIRYGHGIDVGGELVTIAEMTGDIKKAGAWYSIECLPDDVDKSKFKYQGFDKISQALNSDPALYQTVYQATMSKL